MSEKSSRILLLDIIRGFALLGILIVNMPSFHSPEFIKTYYSIPANFQGIERAISLFLNLFIQMKFYPIFAFLFGLGFYLLIQKFMNTTLFISRMICLFIFGLFHLIFLWYGDILHIYAICGLVLLFFQKVSSEKILTWSIVFLTIYHLLLLISVFFPVQTSTDSEKISNIISTYTTMYTEAGYVDWLVYRFQIEVLPILFQLPLTMIPILGYFLLGLYTGKKELFVLNEINRFFIKKCWKYSLIISIPMVILNGLSFFIQNVHVKQGLSHFFTSVSGLSLSIFYMSSIFIVQSYPSIYKFFKLFRFVGQMALTNYLLQSIVSISFYRIFHLYSEINLVEGMIITLVIYCAQIVFSYYWLTYFYYGPAEWLWRSITNGKLQPLKKRSA